MKKWHTKLSREKVKTPPSIFYFRPSIWLFEKEKNCFSAILQTACYCFSIRLFVSLQFSAFHQNEKPRKKVEHYFLFVFTFLRPQLRLLKLICKQVAGERRKKKESNCRRLTVGRGKGKKRTGNPK
jgi:hypothetical protein